MQTQDVEAKQEQHAEAVIKNQCSWPECKASQCDTLCDRCRIARYCSVECQRKDWTDGNHKKQCQLGARCKTQRRVVKLMWKAFEGLPPQTRNVLERILSSSPQGYASFFYETTKGDTTCEQLQTLMQHCILKWGLKWRKAAAADRGGREPRMKPEVRDGLHLKLAALLLAPMGDHMKVAVREGSLIIRMCATDAGGGEHALQEYRTYAIHDKSETTA